MIEIEFDKESNLPIVKELKGFWQMLGSVMFSISIILGGLLFLSLSIMAFINKNYGIGITLLILSILILIVGFWLLVILIKNNVDYNKIMNFVKDNNFQKILEMIFTNKFLWIEAINQVKFDNDVVKEDIIDAITNVDISKIRRIFIIEKLGKSKIEEAIPVLTKLMIEDKSEDIRSESALAVSELEHIDAIDTIKTEMAKTMNKENEFDFLCAVSRLEGIHSKAITKIKELKDIKKLEDWQLDYFDELCTELVLKENYKSTTTERESLRSEAENAIIQGIEDDENTKLLTIIENQLMIIAKLEETIEQLSNDPRMTAEQFQKFKGKEHWIKRYDAVIIGVLGAIATILAAVL